MKRNNQPMFNDGIVKIYRVEDCAAAGDTPLEKLTHKETLRFCRRTVGFRRHYAALQANQRVDAVIRCPFRQGVCTQDVAMLDGRQYRIEQVQRLQNIQPPVMDLTLLCMEADHAAGT